QLNVVDQDSPNVDESNDLQTNHNKDIDNVSVIQESNSSEIPNANAPDIFNDGQEADLIGLLYKIYVKIIKIIDNRFM
ncbi:14371_t:CDS:2, partial [Racocetra fulgida]